MKFTVGLILGVAAGAGATYLVLKKTKGLFLGQGDAVETRDPGVLVRQIRRYAFAASQDGSPIVGLTHASYALVLLDTLEEVVGRDILTRQGLPVKKLRDFITRLQDMHAERLKKCDAHLQKVLEIERREGMQLPGFVVAGAPTGA